MKRLSLNKAKEAKKKYKNNLIIAADTVVYARRSIFLKTTDQNIAYINLKKLSGRRHTVYTGVTTINANNETSFCLSKTKVKFKQIDEFDIKKYLNSNEWKNSSGSYAIQGYAASFISYVSGSYTSVIGLPMEKIYNILKKNKLIN